MARTNKPSVIANSIRKLTDKKIKQIEAATKANAKEFVTIAKKKAPINIGKLRQGITLFEREGLKFSIIATEPYSAYVEFGTGQKVSVPPEFADMAANLESREGGFKQGLQSIKDWCRNKGIPEEAAYPIFLKILRVGIEPQPFMYPAFQQIRKQYLSDVKKIVNGKSTPR